MSIYLSLGSKKHPYLRGIYSSQQKALEADRCPYVEKKDVSFIDEKTGDITFSDGSMLVLNTQCLSDGWSGCSREIELDYDYKPENVKQQLETKEEDI